MQFIDRAKISVKAGDGGHGADIAFVVDRNRNNWKDWLVLATKDMSLTAEEVIRIYGKRWGIEVFSRCARVSFAWKRTATIFRMMRWQRMSPSCSRGTCSYQ